MIYVLSGGGSDLNFKVIAVASESALPTSAAENTIAVITTTPISEWEMSAVTSPTWSAPEGFVYITTRASYLGDGIAFNAIKRNGLWVYPTGCQQYVSGAWVSKIAKIYQNGAWAGEGGMVKTWLYNNGDECQSITGGWAAKAVGIQNYPALAPTVTKNDGLATISLLTSTTIEWKAGIYATNKQIDLTNYQTLTLHGRGEGTDEYCKAWLVALPSLSEWQSYPQVSILNQSMTDISLDVSALSGGYFIAIGVAKSSASTISYMQSLYAD